MLILITFAIIFAQQAAPADKAVLKGTVINAVTGEPVKKAQVTALPSDKAKIPASTTSDDKGNFVLADMEPGRYTVEANRSGYLRGIYGTTRASLEGSAVMLSGQQELSNLRIKLTPLSVISGVIRDTEGEPLIGIGVSVYKVVYEKGHRRLEGSPPVSTDDLGQYRVTVEPGTYYVLAAEGSRYTQTEDHTPHTQERAPVTIGTYYPGTADPTAARPVEVAAGNRPAGVDITMARSRVYKILVRNDPSDSRPAASLFFAGDSTLSAGNQTWRNEDGNQIIPGVPPGSYNLHISGGKANGNCWSNTPIIVGNTDIEVSPAAPVCAELAGRVVVEGLDDKTIKESLGRDISLTFDGLESLGTSLLGDATFSRGLPAGRHTVDFAEIIHNGGFYVKAATVHAQEVLTDGFTLSNGEHTTMDIVLGRDGGRISGVLLDADNSPVGGARVVLIPNKTALRARPDILRETTTDQNGSFTLKDIGPGEYKIFAWTDVENGSWYDPDFLKNYETKAEPVSIRANDRQSVSIHLTAAAR